MEIQVPQYLQTEAFSEKMRQDTVRYLAENLKKFLRTQDRVLLCFTDYSPCSLGGLMTDAVRLAEGIPVAVGEDRRWKSILRLAFLVRTTAMIGPPDVILGLTKIARATATPLFIRDVVLCGRPADSWLCEGIRRGLDCRIRSCYAPGGIVAGFGGEGGISLRADAYQVLVLDASGQPLSDGVAGSVAITSLQYPERNWLTGETGTRQGSELRELSAQVKDERGLRELKWQLLSWFSILDYRAVRTIFGVDLEIIKFPGEKIPKLPSCAKLTVRNWNAEQDAPFCMQK